MSTQPAIADVLRDLERVAPCEHKPSFQHLRSKIEYTAPELLGMCWHETHKLLLEITPESGSLPAWVQQASEIWNKANQGSSTNTAPGSSLQ